MNELFFEIGTEEIPAAFLPGALQALREKAVAHLEKLGVPFAEARSLGTPRRLVLRVTGLPLERPVSSRLITGPPARAAFGPDGGLTRAGEGFARGQGVDPGALFVEETPRGAYVAVRKQEGGEPLHPLLAAFLPELVKSLAFKKSMRWADSELRFARPIHWFVATFAGKVLEFELDGLTSGRTSHGMRFFGPRMFDAPDFEAWSAGCRAAHIVPDPQQRRDKIRAELENAAAAVGGRVDMDEHLLEEATYLTECPRVVMGSFEDRFLEMPAEVAVTVMKHHQRYFPITDREGRLLPRFLAVVNTPTERLEPIVHGNERVLRARLSDGNFFWEEDLRHRLEARVESLVGIVFHARLGTSREKVARIERLADWLSGQVLSGQETLHAEVLRAARLAKADLVSRMVGEFPELQGIMGGIYAARQGESPRVARAIREHYLPAQAGGALPTTDAGAILSIADKLDSVVAFIGVGLAPTASTDPFALRRQALGILHLLVDRGWNVSLRALVQEALAGLQDKIKRPPAEVEDEVLEFLRVRLRGLLTGEGAPTDLVDAVIAADSDRVPDVQQRLAALRELSLVGDFKPLMVAFKRATNITRDQQEQGDAVLEGLLPVESALHEATRQAAQHLAADVAEGAYPRAMSRLLELKEPIDRFFEGVMVLDPEPAVRSRRLAILREVTALFRGVADLSRISAES